MLKNIMISVFLLLLVTLSYAEDDIDAARKQATIQWMKAEGLPVPDGGIIVKPESQFFGYKENQASIESDNASIKKYGYIKEDSNEVRSLLNFTKGNRKLSTKNLNASADTGLYGSINDIQMAYIHYGVPKFAMTKELGVAPAGGYIDEKGAKGWTGAAQIFEKDGIGTCNYVETNAKLNHSSTFVAQEKATYDINGKVTVKNIKGEEGKGFMYIVHWFDDNFYRELKCAQPEFSNQTMAAVIKLAILIDNNSH